MPPRRLPLLLLLIPALLAGCGGGSKPAAPQGGVLGESASSAAAACDVVGAPGGRPGADGTASDPLRGAQAVMDRLGPGQTGCLRAGTYPGQGKDGYAVRVNRGGTKGRPVTLRGYPGERATLAGVVVVPQGSDDVRLSHLAIDDPTSFAQAGQITVQVNARRTTLDHLRITNGSRKSCVQLGTGNGWGSATAVTLTDSLLYDCGNPGNNMRDHAVYAGNVRGGTIARNVIWGAGGWGLHLYPNAHGLRVQANVVVDNGGGVIVAGEGSEASSRNVLTDNVISGSSREPDLSVYWGGRIGAGNVARGNCIGDRVTSMRGLKLESNRSGRPSFADAAAHDYRFSGGGCSAAGRAAVGVHRLG